MASPAQSGGGVGGTEGGHTTAFGNFDIPVPVSDVPLDNRNQAIDNRITNVDVTTVANDRPNDDDYDDPYPGGSAPMTGDTALGC